MYERFISSSMLTGMRDGSGVSMVIQQISASIADASVLRLPIANCRLSMTPVQSDIEVLDIQRVVFNELAARLDLIAHQRREHQVGFRVIFGAYLEQCPARGIHRRFPERLRVHLTEALVPVHGDATASGGDEELDQLVQR